MGLFSNKKEKSKGPETSAIDAINSDEMEKELAPEWYLKYKTLQNFPHSSTTEEYKNIVLTQEAKAAFVSYVKEVMPVPSASFSIYQKLTKENVTMKDVAILVASDPLLAANVLRTVNSAAYFFSTEITSVGRAVTLLGLQTIKRLVLSQTMKDSLRGDLFDQQYNEKIRVHSAMVSALSQHLCNHYTDLDPNDIATVALLHDIGKMLYRKLVRKGKSINTKEAFPPLMIEAVIASVFAELWELPEFIVSTLEFIPYPLFYSMDILTSKECQMVTVIQAANFIANAIDFEDGDRLLPLRDEYLLAASFPLNPGEWIIPTMVVNIEKSRSALV